MRKITEKAKRIYEDTKKQCLQHVIDWGYNEEKDGGLNRCATDERISKRVYNDMKIILKEERRELEIDLELGIVTDKIYDLHYKALSMLEKTIS